MVPLEWHVEGPGERTPVAPFVHMHADVPIDGSKAATSGRDVKMSGGALVSRIAIADDDSDSLDLLGEFLRSPTTEISKAGTGPELVELLAAKGPFDLIVTDVDMPWMEGLSVIRAARAAEIHTPVIVVTGMSQPDMEAMVAGFGNAILLRKPIELATLRAAVAQLLGYGR